MMNDTQTLTNEKNRTHQSSLIWDESLIRRYDLSGPRYTSYPTAPQFLENFDQTHWHNAMEAGNQNLSPLSLYLHIPFCDTICFYCGCHKVVTANRRRATPYIEALKKEIDLQSLYVNPSRLVNQLHWGGGTPTYLNDEQITELMEHLHRSFSFSSDDKGEYSIEIHPQTVTPQRLAHLRQLGFNRLSFGVQDFNTDVQKAVNRFNSEQEVKDLIHASQALGYRSLNLDLIYGLPKQTADSFATTLDTIIQMKPNRLSLFNYAHMPHLFKSQKQIDATQLPEPQEKLQILHNSIEQLCQAGYVYIGMDHFALPDDELAIAQQKGTLHRNFQGYSTHSQCDLMAFGVSSISAVGNTYIQNVKDIQTYQDCLANQQLPFQKGILLSQDDCIRQRVINRLICQFELHFDEIEKEFHIDFQEYFCAELQQLNPFANDQLLILSDRHIQVTAQGRLLIRRICMTFDAYLKKSQPSHNNRYSRII